MDKMWNKIKTGFNNIAKAGGAEAGGEDKAKLQYMEKGLKRLESAPPVTKEGYAKMKLENQEKAEKWLAAYGKFTYLAWDADKNDYVDKTLYKNPVGQESGAI